jgi:hypothetical protein
VIDGRSPASARPGMDAPTCISAQTAVLPALTR